MATPPPQGREHSPTADHGDQTPRSGVVCSASSRADVATPSPPPPSPPSSPASTPTKSVRIHVLSYSKQQQQQHQTTTLDDDSTDYDVTGIEFDEEISLITPSFYSFIFFGADFDESIIRWRETDGTASGHIPFDFRLFLGCLDGNQFFFKLKKKLFPSTPHFKRSRSINFGDPRLFFRFIASDLVFRGSHRFLVFLPFLLRLCCRNVNGTGIVPGFTKFSTNVLGIALLIESAWIETSFSQFHHFLLRFHRVLPSFTGFNWFFFTEFRRGLLSFLGFQLRSMEFLASHRVLPSFTGFRRFSLGFALYWVSSLFLPSFSSLHYVPGGSR